MYRLCLSVCLFVSNKRQNGWTERPQMGQSKLKNSTKKNVNNAPIQYRKICENLSLVKNGENQGIKNNWSFDHLTLWHKAMLNVLVFLH